MIEAQFYAVYSSNSSIILKMIVDVLLEEPRPALIHNFCTHFRRRGVCTLFLEGESTNVHGHFMQSATAFLWHLENAEEEEKVSSFAKPFFDAMGSEYWPLCVEIAERSRSSWNPDYEYEDDFLYIRFLMDWGLLGRSDAHCEALLERYEEVLEGASDTRLDLCRTLLERDAVAFDKTLRFLLVERQDLLEDYARRGIIDKEAASWLRHYSGEGLALLALAEKMGIPTGTGYLHCPEVLRHNPNTAFDRDAWRRG